MSLKRIQKAAVWLSALYFLIPSLVWANVLQGVRVWPSPDETRVVVDLADEANFSYFSLTKPDRLVVDLKSTSLKTKLPITVSDSPVLSRIRQSSPPEQGTYRLVFELKKSAPAELFKLAPTLEVTTGTAW